MIKRGGLGPDPKESNDADRTTVTLAKPGEQALLPFRRCAVQEELLALPPRDRAFMRCMKLVAGARSK
jgi:hypothetical protein